MLHRIAIAIAACAACACADANLVPNGDFQADTDKDGKPDGWPLQAGVTWEAEKGNRFLRLTGAGTSTQVSVYREIPLNGAKAVKVSYRVRYADVKRGSQPWHDARVVMEARDAQKADIKGILPHLFFTGTSSGWVEKSFSRVMPAEAVSITIMPALFMIEGGTFDIDDLSIVAVDPATVQAAKK